VADVTELRGSRALVTGAYGGLGRAMAKALKAQGSEVVVTGRRPGPLHQVAQEVGARAIVGDLSVRADLHRIVDEAGQLDVLVANAALPGTGLLPDWGEEQIDRILEVNLADPIVMTRALLPGFLERRKGHFVYVSSLSGKVASRGGAMYSATKFGLRGFAGGLRCDLQGTGIGCSVIFPGFVREAGMFADSGTTLPFGVGTVSPKQVAAAVVKAIATNRAEITVAPLVLRAGAALGGLVPGLSAPIQAKLDRGLSNRFIAAQKQKR
jgi:short-subunit dehydrogenase